MAGRRDQASLPGSWRGVPPTVGGTGSGAGPKGAERVGFARTGGGSWTPTVANLIVLIGIEIVAYCLLRYAFRTVHGG